MSKISLLMLMALFAASFIGCAQTPSPKDSPATATAALRTFEKGDNSKAVILKIGEEFKIQLKGVPTAGYMWKIMDMNKTQLKMLSEEVKSLTPPGMVGGSSMFIWRFSAQTAGESRLVLKNFRSWEGADKAAETFTLKITVKKN